jgi:serine phosphatase RsbU (regulator of sigma subunit)
MLLTVAPITNELGEITHYLGAMTNISRRKEREQELLRWKREFSDSLAYAERIQRRFLSNGKESVPFSAFGVWYAPQIQVGGDFYTVQQVEGGGTIVGIGDCTGHGVPAALLSIYAQTTLRQALSQYQADLEKVYTHLIEDVQEVFGGQSPLLDGFELALLWYDPQTKRAKYIGVRRPLWVLRGGDIFIVSGDRRDISVTLSDRLSTALPSVQSLTLLPKDRLFLFSDGIVDQLNSEGKRFSTTRLRSFLQTNSYLSLNEQVELLKQAIRHWAGGMPQSDDILFLAMEV